MGRIVGLNGQPLLDVGERRQLIHAGLDDMATWARRCEERSQLSRAVRRAKQVRMADGLFYLDQRAPFITVDVPSVTLAATAKALYTPSYFPTLGGNYWTYPGKAIYIRAFGRITTAATPGNGSFDIYNGNGTDANGTIIVSSAALALTLNQTNVSWWLELVIRCRITGLVGTLFGTGAAHFNVGVLASTLQPMLLPASAPAASATHDLTPANIISVQFKRSGSTVETMQVHEMAVVALN